MPSLEQFLQGLASAQLCALLFVRNLPQPLRERFSSEHIRFIDSAVNLADVASQASWVVSNCNHNTVAYFAQRGIPQLLIPSYQEHLFLALRLVQQGAAAMAYQDQPAYSAAINAMQTHAPLRQQAQLLAGQMTPYEMLDAEKHIGAAFHRMLL
jgi:UDP:flavonoid glycosyltransferase YjiC (YdhE family)